MSSSVKLDHIGVAIKDLERGRQAYERLGFKLTPRSIHRGSPTPGAPVVPFGSGNHCAMFHEGYLEIVGLIDPTIFSNIKPLVARYEGAHIVAFGVDSADATYQELADRGIPIERARQLERDAAYGLQNNELKRAAFRNMYFAQDVYPEARLLYIEHLTRDVLWQPHLLDHPNGIVALTDVFLCVPDARAAADKYSALFGRPAEQVMPEEWRIALAHGQVWVAAPHAWAARSRGAAAPALPSPAGIGFKVTNLAATRALLAGNGVKIREGTDGGLWIAPEHACGAAIYFSDLN